MKEYFSHDHNARNDRKVISLVDKYKAAGYGIFWATNEMMHEEGGELEFDEITFGAISKQLNEEKSLIKEVISDCINVFKLYTLCEANEVNKKFASNRVKRNLTGIWEKKNEKSEKAALAGRLGGIKSGESRRSKQTLQANEAPLEANRSNEAKVNESKVKKSKVNENIAPVFFQSNNSPIIPQYEEVHRVFLQNGGTEIMAKTFFHHYEGLDWFKNGSAIKKFSSLVPAYIETWKKNDSSKLNGNRELSKFEKDLQAKREIEKTRNYE